MSKTLNSLETSNLETLITWTFNYAQLIKFNTPHQAGA